MTRKKTLLRWLTLACLIGVVSVGIPVYQRIHAFSVEDSIHSRFFPLASALYAYQEQHAAPAPSLDAVVPSYIAQLPSSPLVDRISYSVLPDRQGWELVLHSRALFRPRLYICRSTQQFTSAEMQRVILQYHATWTILPSES